MEKKNQSESEKAKSRENTQNLIILIFRGIIPIVLLLSGLILLYLRLPGWSIIFGLPLTVIGSVFLIYSYDEMVSKRINHYHDEDEEGV